MYTAYNFWHTEHYWEFTYKSLRYLTYTYNCDYCIFIKNWRQFIIAIYNENFKTLDLTSRNILNDVSLTYIVSWCVSFWKFFVWSCCFRLENLISSPYLGIYFEGIDSHRGEKHLVGSFTVRKKSITGKILVCIRRVCELKYSSFNQRFRTNGFL